MKRILLYLLLLVVLLGVFILVRTLSFRPVAYQPLSERITAKAHPKVLAKAMAYETISHKPGMIDQEAFSGFHKHLQSSFPLIDSILELKTVEEYSLVYYWQGTEESLKPVILMGHMDVVPVEYSTRDEWHHPPFGGIISDEFIYGRGALDDKGSLIAIMDAVENLLASGYRPRRSIYLCFGHDEEIGGANGAEKIRDYLKSRGVKAWFVLDEGGTLASGIIPGIADTVALIGTSEKGYVSLEISASIAGGHSSMPEKINALTSVNNALVKLNDNPLPYRLSPPLEGFVDHVGPHLTGLKKMAFANTWLFKSLIYGAYSKSAAGEALIHTTQVATIFNAGVKDNVVPYRAQAVVNYRLLPGDTPEFILERAREVINDTLVKVRVYQDLAIPASPVSEIDCDQFRNISGAVLATNPTAIVSPYLVLGATDGRHFYELSDYVYRFSPIPLGKDDLARFHGVNERVALKSYQKAVDFYATLLNSL
jgi:carboxypeptidase PM20D1